MIGLEHEGRAQEERKNKRKATKEGIENEKTDCICTVRRDGRGRPGGLLERGEYAIGGAYALSSLAACVLGVVAGKMLVRWALGAQAA